jgi:hypothetical protein
MNVSITRNTPYYTTILIDLTDEELQRLVAGFLNNLMKEGG